MTPRDFDRWLSDREDAHMAEPPDPVDEPFERVRCDLHCLKPGGRKLNYCDNVREFAT